ncbi:MAG: type IV pilus assembly protein PilM [Phycisphaerae bacterium]
MATPKTVWGIDIGQSALKALKLRGVDGELYVEAFDIIEHPKILSQPDADRDQLIRNALEQFLARNSVAGTTVAISVPGQSGFARFVKLPPVETKRIPEIVRFEAEQQIPFPMEEIIWDYQTFQDPDSPDIELGLFAMKRDTIRQTLSFYSDLEVDVDVVQMAPLALYNFMEYDGHTAEEGATLLVDVGAEKTELAIADQGRLWTRTIQIGGNNFTEALVRAFKLSFAKAEKLKRTAASSKYARQIFQAMRPVFADLVQEIQRSIGFYTSTHRDTRLQKLVGLGNGFRLPGLQKFLEQNLNISVSRVDSYNRLTPSPAVNAPSFSENVLSFAVAYGLALQALGQTAITTNLLPTEIAKRRVWSRKRPWFGVAAAMLAIFAFLPTVRSHMDLAAVPEDLPSTVVAVNEQMDSNNARYNRHRGTGRDYEEEAREALQLYAHRTFWPTTQLLLSESIARAAPDLALPYEELKQKDRSRRRILIIESMEAVYQQDLVGKSDQDGDDSIREEDERVFPRGRGRSQRGRPSRTTEGATQRGFLVTVVLRTPMSERQAVQNLIQPLRNELVKLAGVYEADQPREEWEEPGQPDFQLLSLLEFPQHTVLTGDRPAGVSAGSRYGREYEDERGEPGYVQPSGDSDQQEQLQRPDPYFPTEESADDVRIQLTFKVAVTGDGVKFISIEDLATASRDRR